MQETQETNLHPWFGKIPLEKEMAIRSSIPAGKSHGQRSLVGCGSWGHRESDRTEPRSTDALRQQ